MEVCNDFYLNTFLNMFRFASFVVLFAGRQSHSHPLPITEWVFLVTLNIHGMLFDIADNWNYYVSTHTP